MKAADLAIYNNITATKQEWFEIFTQVGLPKSMHFWMALRHQKFMTRVSRNQYLLRDVHPDTFNSVWDEYCKYNRLSVKKAYQKKQLRKKIREQLRNNRSERLVNYNGSYITWTDYKYEIENQ